MQDDKIKIAYRKNPFSLGHIDYEVLEGRSISQMIQEVGIAPIAEIHDGVFVYIGDELIERNRWDEVKLVRGSIVSVGITPGGGGGEGGKNPARTVALLAVMVVAIVASSYFPPAMGLAAGSAEALFAGAAIGAAVSMAGSMLVNALIPLPTSKNNNENNQYYISGMSNSIDLYGPIPRLFGKKKIFPRYAAMPYSELVGTDEQYLRALFIIGKGQYDLSNFKIGETLLSDFTDVEMEKYYSGTSTSYRLFSNDVSETPLTIELLYNVSQTRTTGDDIDEIIFEITFPEGHYEIHSNNKRKAAVTSFLCEYSVKNANQWINFSGLKRLNFSGYPDKLISPGQTVVGPSGTGTIQYVYADSYIISSENNAEGQSIFNYEDYVKAVDIIITDGTFSNSDSVIINGIYNANISVISSTVTEVSGKYGTPLKKSFSVKVPRDAYDVRITRLTADADDENITSSYWTCLRTITYQTPVPYSDCTLIALRIKATGQLNGMLDQFNLVAEALVNAHDGIQWDLIKTRNPAWAFVEVLCGNSNKRPVATTRLNITALRTWAARCEASGFNFDAVIDFKSTVWELLRQICAVGRASPGMTDNQYTVIEDIEQTIPIQQFSPRNSWNFSGSRVFPDIPHALRIRFDDETNDYKEEEVSVYDDGYTSVNATLYETLDFFGVVNHDHIWKLARYHIAVMRLRSETYIFDTDIEHMVCTRGDLVRITHDVLMVGLGQGRIKTISTTRISIDDTISMEAGKTYGFQFRRSDGTFKTCTITTSVGKKEAGTLLVINPELAAQDLPSVGDLAFFGESGTQSSNVIISRIEPGPDLTARLYCIPYNQGIYTADTGTIPGWTPNITIPPIVSRTPPKPRIISATYVFRTTTINPDGTYQLVMSVGFDAQVIGFVQTGSTDPNFQPPDVTQGFQAQYNEDNGNWISLPDLGRDVRSFEFLVDNEVTYDIRIRSFSIPGVYSEWDTLLNITTNYTSEVSPDISGLQRVGGGTSFNTKDLEVEWTALPGNDDEGVSIFDYKVEVLTSDGNTSLRTEYVAQNKYLYDFDKNIADGGPRPAVTIRVWARNKFNAISVTPASLVFTNPVPGNPQSLTSFAPMGGIEFSWAANTEPDFSHFLYRTKVGSGGTWSNWERTQGTSIQKILTSDEKI